MPVLEIRFPINVFYRNSQSFRALRSQNFFIEKQTKTDSKHSATNAPAMYVCVLCVLCSHLFWTSSSLDVPAGVTQEEGHTWFVIHLPSAVRALIFLARRIQPFLSLVDRGVEFGVLTI